MEEEEVVCLKVFDEERGDVVFEGKVSTDITPEELVKLRCFRERSLRGIFNKSTNEKVKSFEGLQNNVELVVGRGGPKDFAGVLHVGADDGVLRKSRGVSSRECALMSVWSLSHEECEKAFKCETLEELAFNNCQLIQIPKEIGKMKKLKKLTLYGLTMLTNIPEEMGELLGLEELRMGWCGIESLPKILKDLKLNFISLEDMDNLRLNAEDLVVFSKLKHLKIKWCSNAFTPSFTPSFWEMIKSSTDLRVLGLDWNEHNQKIVVAALVKNGSIVDGGKGSELYAHLFKRNRENHERAHQCVVHLLAIRRWRNALNNVPKEMVKMIAMMLWNTKCVVNAWRKK